MWATKAQSGRTLRGEDGGESVAIGRHRRSERPFAFEHGGLPAKSGGVQTEAVPRDEECAKLGDYRKNKCDHHSNRMFKCPALAGSQPADSMQKSSFDDPQEERRLDFWGIRPKIPLI